MKLSACSLELDKGLPSLLACCASCTLALQHQSALRYIHALCPDGQENHFITDKQQ